MSSSIRTVNWRSPTANAEFVDSLHNSGFVVLTNHPLDAELLSNLYSHWRSFFADETKYQYQISADTDRQQGFTPADISETAVGHAQRDLKEFFHFAPGTDAPPVLQDITQRYWDAAFAVGRALLQWTEAALPKDLLTAGNVSLMDMLSEQASLLRVLHYPPLSGAEEAGAVRAAAHQDINLITVLPVSNQPGLQVQSRGGDWLDISSNPGDLIVNSGDMLTELTGGFLPSTTHRVVNPDGNIANESRISSPLFLTPALDVVLSERYTAGSYLQQRMDELKR